MRPMKHKKKMSNCFRRYWQLYALMALPVIYFLVFKYLPMVGNIIAFRRFKLGGNILGAEWVGFRYFEKFMKDPTFWRAFRNTISLSLLNLIINFPVPIIFSLLLNELRNYRFKKLVQTISYLPRFFATVVIISIMTEMFSPTTGVVNIIRKKLFGLDSVFFMNDAEYFRPMYILSDMWQFTGYNAVIYLAAITGISNDLYEAAKIDGANRWQQTVYVTLPSIMGTVMVMLILNIGRLMSVAFEKILLMYTSANSTVSDVIDTMVYRVGLTQTNYSYATAVGLFGAVVSLVLVFSANQISRRVTGESLY